jgi:hypothetical protein
MDVKSRKLRLTALMPGNNGIVQWSSRSEVASTLMTPNCDFDKSGRVRPSDDEALLDGDQARPKFCRSPTSVIFSAAVC